MYMPSDYYHQKQQEYLRAQEELDRQQKEQMLRHNEHQQYQKLMQPPQPSERRSQASENGMYTGMTINKAKPLSFLGTHVVANLEDDENGMPVSVYKMPPMPGGYSGATNTAESGA